MKVSLVLFLLFFNRPQKLAKLNTSNEKKNCTKYDVLIFLIICDFILL